MTSAPVAVIGGSLSGLAAACTLAGRGYPVALFEQAPNLGGQFAKAESAECCFDKTPGFLTSPRVLDRIFREGGRQLSDYVELIPVDPQCRCFFTDGRVLDFCRDIDETCANIERLASGASAGYRRFLDVAKRMDIAADALLYWRSVAGLKDMIRPSKVGKYLTLRTRRTASHVIRTTINNHQIATAVEGLLCQHEFNRQPPALACAAYHLRFAEGAWYPRGGISSIAKALEKLAIDLGILIHRNSRVQSVDLNSQGRVHAITINGESNQAVSAAVSTIGHARPAFELLEKNRWPLSEHTENHIIDTLIINLSVNGHLDRLAHHNLFFCDEGLTLFSSPMHVWVPSSTDSSAAPIGATALTIAGCVPPTPKSDWQKTWKQCRETILRRVAGLCALTDLEQRITCELVSPHTPFDDLPPCAFRQPNRSQTTPGLYFAGGDSHPGCSIPMLLMSGWIAADALDEDAFHAGVQPPRRPH